MRKRLHRLLAPRRVRKNVANVLQLRFEDSVLHSDDEPSVVYLDNTKEWYQNGRLHRDNGPAIEYSDGRKEWYKEGKFVKSEK